MFRFWSKVRPTGFCWEWTASTKPAGYGQFRMPDGRLGYAHRVAYELLVGSIPEGMQLDHLCRNRACVNPDHLEPVTQAENKRRGMAGAYQPNSHNGNKTHCKWGHEFVKSNTYITSEGKRQCKACQRMRKGGKRV